MAHTENRKKTPSRIEFGEKVLLIRRQMKLTQAELAVKAEMHVTYVGSIERGERNIALENIIKLARALNVSPKDLLPQE